MTINERIKKLKWDRIQKLKKLKKIANVYLEENKKIKDLHHKSWEFNVVEKNIKELRKIITHLNKESGEAKLNQYAQDQISLDSAKLLLLQHPEMQEYMRDMRFGSQKYEIMCYSPSFSVIHDLYWLEDGTLQDRIDVTLGITSPSIFGKYLPSKIEIIEKNVIPLLETKKNLSDSSRIVSTAITSIKNEEYSTGNILLITAIEGIVRKLCYYIYSSQNQAKSKEEVEYYIYSKFLSLETLLTKGDFKPDFGISLIDGYLLNKHVISEELEEIEILYNKYLEKCSWIKTEYESLNSKVVKAIEEEKKQEATDILITMQNILGDGPMSSDEIVKISIKARLQFLLRSYKEDRNLIIHGKYSEFNKKWKSYIYSSALCKVIEVIKTYPHMK